MKRLVIGVEVFQNCKEKTESSKGINILEAIGATMSRKHLKSKNKKTSREKHSRRNPSFVYLKLQYKFWILIGVLILAGISILLRLEAPVVWTFLYGIGGWAALTTNPGNNFH